MLDKNLYKFFKEKIPANGDTKRSDELIKTKMNVVLNSLSVLYDIIPAGDAVTLRIQHGKIILSPNNKAVGKMGQLIVTKPIGVLDLESEQQN